MEESPQTKKQSILTYFKETSWFERIMIFVVIGYFVYLNQVTAIVPNFNNETQSLLYTETSNVPKSNVSNSQMFFGILLFLFCIFVLLQKRVSSLKRATPKEAMDHLSSQLKELKEIPLGDGSTLVLDDSTNINISPQFITRYMESNNERKEFRYTFLAIVTNRYLEVTHYFKMWYEPWKRYWDGFYESESALRDKDRCPNCGNESDIKYLYSEDFRKFIALKRGLSPGAIIK